MFPTLFLTALCSLSAVLAAPILISRTPKVDFTSFDQATTGTPAHYFSGDAAIPVKQLAAAALAGKKSAATYPISVDSKVKSTIYSDWVNFPDVSAYVFTADMDVDCDGKDYKCKGNGDGQAQTDWGNLAAYAVPFIVMPDSFVSQHSKQLPGNNIAAVICDGSLFYGILGDTNGDDPQVTGEASWLMARTCFPDANLNGGAGHGAADVTYIVFNNEVLPSSAHDGKYITDFDTLKNTGDGLVKKLVKNLGLTSSSSAPVDVSTSTPADDDNDDEC